MNWDIVKGKWDQFTGKMKEEFGDLTDDELTQMQWGAEQASGVIQEKYGKTKAEADEMIEEISKSCES